MIGILKLIFIVFIAIASLVFISTLSSLKCEKRGDTLKKYYTLCYFTDWSYYRHGKGSFKPSDIDTQICSHIMYSFVLLKVDVEKNEVDIVPADSNTDLTLKFYEQVTALKEQNLEVVLVCGGWNDSTKKYSVMMSREDFRTQFVTKVLIFLLKYGFTGFELDVEYPGYYQMMKEEEADDKTNFVLLLQELRKAFDEKMKELNSSERLSLSIAASVNEKVIKISYDIPAIAEVCDWIGLMAYDFHSSADGETGLNAPFKRQPGDTGSDRKFNVKSAIKLWLDADAPANKLILGMPCYGKLFALDDPNDTKIHAKATGTPFPGEFTNSTQTLAFYEIADNVKLRSWKVVHENYLGSYAYLDTRWVGYDDKFDVAVKAEYIKKKCLLGAMFWASDLDCFQRDGSCKEIYPLISTVKKVLDDEIKLDDVVNYT